MRFQERGYRARLVEEGEDRGPREKPAEDLQAAFAATHAGQPVMNESYSWGRGSTRNQVTFFCFVQVRITVRKRIFRSSQTLQFFR